MCEDLELDNDSRLVSYKEYTPFGASAYRLCTANALRKYRFAGSQHDHESSLYHGGEWYYAACNNKGKYLLMNIESDIEKEKTSKETSKETSTGN